MHSGIGMQHRKTRTFYILVILIPEFWIKKRALESLKSVSKIGEYHWGISSDIRPRDEFRPIAREGKYLMDYKN